MFHQLTRDERKILHIVEIFSGSISFLSSISLMRIIFKSKIKFTVPYRRIIFGLAIFDLIYSIANIATVPMLPSSDTVWGSMGNQQSCEALGFLIFVGATGNLLYILSLCAFFICQLVFRINKRTLARKIEPWFHATPFLLSFTGATSLLVHKYFNLTQYKMKCWVSPYPPNCLYNDDVPCVRGTRYRVVRFVLALFVQGLTFSTLCATMACIYYKVRKQGRTQQKYNFSAYRSSNQSSADVDSKGPNLALNSRISRRLSSTSFTGWSVHHKNRSKAVITQSLLYITGFCFTWGPVVLVVIVATNGNEIAYVLRVLSRFFNPLSGFFNLLIFLRPILCLYRKKHPENSWMRAFFIIILSGNDTVHK